MFHTIYRGLRWGARRALLGFALLLPVFGQETPRQCSNPTGSNAIAAGELVTCSVTAIAGNEWTFTAAQGEIYSALFVETAGGSSSNPVVKVYDPSGKVLTGGTYTDHDTLEFTVSTAGRYRIAFTEGTTQGSFNAYSYILSFIRVAPVLSDAPYMPLNLAFTSAIDPVGDRDVYLLNVEAGDRLSYRFTRTSGSGTQTAYIYDSLGGKRNLYSGSYVIPAKGVYTIIVEDTGTHTSTGNFAITCVGVCPGPPTVTSLFPHYAEGAGWSSDILLVNNSNLPTWYTYRTRSSDGLKSNSTQNSLAPYGSVILSTISKTTDALTQGSSVVIAPPSVGGQLIFRAAAIEGQRGQQAASVPLVANGTNSWILPFDNRNGFASGLAISTLADTATALRLTAVDSDGAAIQSGDLTLNPNGHTAFVLTDQLAATAGKRGLLTISATSGYNIGVVGLRFSPQGAFTSLAPAAVTAASTSSTPTSQTYYVAQLASGGGWSTELYAFSRDRAATTSLKLASFQGVGTTVAGLAPAWTGSGQAWNLSYDTLPTSSTVDQMLGTNLFAARIPGVEATTQVGWLSASRTGDFGGLAIFRQDVSGDGRIPQEASVPFFPAGVSHFFIPSDERSGLVGIAMANPSGTDTRNVTIAYRNSDGVVTGQSRFTMPPLAHFAVTIDTLIPAAAGTVGTIEVTSTNGDVAGIGLLFQGSAFTALPAVY